MPYSCVRYDFWDIHNLWEQELDTLLLFWTCAKNLIYAFDQLGGEYPCSVNHSYYLIELELLPNIHYVL